MKRIPALLLFLVCMSVSSYGQLIENESSDTWHSDKFSMFIHFGLYSHLGGVWDGEPVRQGYSEQIQSFAGIFSDWYAETAYEFKPDRFNADEIALLAKKAGMRSIVFTSKHHDGFCMYDTETTSYDSMDMLPVGRDFVRELSEACRMHGLKFGLYFSLIDWNYPHAYPISSHNADFVTPQHHEFSKRQIRELLTSYGDISELWFDMGSLEPWQSKEMYELVKSLQPDCMVSGRLGNDFYDFAVMADNKLPQTALHTPWQSAVSMFPETWSYRSWQERGEVADKVAEKLRTLIAVVSRGGNFLLNIGPSADGSVVPFEEEVLLEIGRWLDANGDAVYGTSRSPFQTDFPWGDITVRDNMMNLLLTGSCPDDGRIVLPLEGVKLRSAKGAEAVLRRGECVVKVSEDMYSDPADVYVVTLVFDRPVTSVMTDTVLPQSAGLSRENAVARYSYSCFDYYSNYRSTVSYGWNVDVRRPSDELEIIFTSEEEGREIILEIDGEKLPLVLKADGKTSLPNDVAVSGHGISRLRGGVFDGPSSWESLDRGAVRLSYELVIMNVRPFSNHLMCADVEVSEDGLYLFDMTSGNGMELVLDGESVMKHLNPYRTEAKTEKVLLHLSEGTHELLLRAYNRFEHRLAFGISPAQEQEILKMKVMLPSRLQKGVRRISVHAADRESGHSDALLHNLRIYM